MERKLPRSEHNVAPGATFEESYPRYEFAELVRLALALGVWLVKWHRRGGMRPRLGVSRRPWSGETNPAE